MSEASSVSETRGADEANKSCEYCGETILAVAKKCIHCGSILDQAAGDGAVVKQTSDYGLVLLAIPVVATMLIWFWVGSMSLLQGPGTTLSLILVCTILVTASVAAMEASKAGMTRDKSKGTSGPEYSGIRI